MTAFGHELKAQRERRGITLGTLAAETKVNQRHLEALEQEDFAQLPGGVFRRGILRAYLHVLGLEEDPWMRRFHEALALAGQPEDAGEEAWAAFAENVKRNRSVSGTGVGTRWVGVVVLLLAVCAAALLTWHFVLHRSLLPRHGHALPASQEPAPGAADGS